MSKIAVIIDDMFEDSEYTAPVAAFRGAGHEIIHVGKRPVIIDKNVKELSVEGFDALLIPGGYSPDKLRVDPDAVRFAGEFVKSSKPVFVICHGPQLLITARVLRGRKITGWKSIQEDIINAGAEFIDREVVEDGNLISSRSPADLPAFIKACLKKL